MESPGIRVQLCGRVAIDLGGRRVEHSLPGRQGRLLFVYLAIHRLRAVTRRVPVGEDTPCVRIGDYLIDLQAHRVTGAAAIDAQRPPADLHLTPTEWQLLEQLVRNPGKLVSQRELLLKIWGPKYVDETHYLRQYMAQLRRKLEPDPARPRHLLTELGMGYRYQP